MGLKQIPPAATSTRDFGSRSGSDIIAAAWEEEPAGREAAKGSQGMFPTRQRLGLWSLVLLLLAQHKGYLCMFITKIKLQLLKAVICTWGNIMFVFSCCRDSAIAE